MEELKPNAQNVEDAGLKLPKPEPTTEEKKGLLAKALHNSGLLPRLRTFQGDVAEFIKSKDESLASLALKENAQKREDKKIQSQSRSDSQVNVLMYVLSLLLILGAVATLGYLLLIKMRQEPIEATSRRGLLPAQETVSISMPVLSKEALGESLSALRSSADKSEGVTALEIREGAGERVATANDLFIKMEFSAPGALVRTLSGVMLPGLYKSSDFFLIFKVKDFGALV